MINLYLALLHEKIGIYKRTDAFSSTPKKPRTSAILIKKKEQTNLSITINPLSIIVADSGRLITSECLLLFCAQSVTELSGHADFSAKLPLHPPGNEKS